jgi:hypothetical protein
MCQNQSNSRADGRTIGYDHAFANANFQAQPDRNADAALYPNFHA